jgi:Fe-S cluster assembly protein SufD
LFYLKARGIPGKEAEALLVQAFVGEAIEPLDDMRLKELLMAAAAQWLEARN